MPFTVSHAAAVLPFRRLPLIWSAFIVGSMAPDFPYIIGSTEYRSLGHQWPGLVLFTIPASLLALWLFHNVVKRPIVSLMPGGVQERLRGHIGNFNFGSGTRFVAILGSIVCGIATHIVWDSFTHSYTWAWERFAWLQGWKRVPVFGLIPTYSLLQYSSTLLGMLALAVWVGLWYRSSTPQLELQTRAQPKSRFWLAVAIFAIAGIAGFTRAISVIGTSITHANADNFLLIFGVTSLALAFWQLLLYCVLVSTHQVWIVP
jgi:hypothetical protein